MREKSGTYGKVRKIWKGAEAGALGMSPACFAISLNYSQ